MSSVEVIGNEQFSNALSNIQQNSSNSTTLKRTTEESGLDSGIPAKRAVMHGMDGSLVQMGGPYMGQNEAITELYPVPENTVGLVIGRGGLEIQSIQTQSGCRVQMSPDADNSGYRQVTLQGMRPNIEKAKQMINDVVIRAQQRQAQQASQTFATAGESGRAITIDLQIPAAKCGLIIGKQGDTIRQLQENSGCKMLMIQDSQEVTGMPKPLRITGDPEKIEVAKRLVADLINKEETSGTGGGGIPNMARHGIPTDGNATAKGEVVVPRTSVGMIIGKSGETIKRLAIETGTKIQFKPDEDPNSAERCAVIMGTRDQIFKATELITELVNKSNNGGSQQPEVFFMHVPSNKTGLVIGKGGETIKQINAESGAHCELSREPPPNPNEKVFMIRGTQQQIHHAQHIIRIKVGDIPPNTPVPMMAGAQIMPNNGGYAQPGQFNGQYGAPQPVQQQWNNFAGAGGIPPGGNGNVWNPHHHPQNGLAGAPAQPQYAAPQYQQQAGVMPGQQFAQQAVAQVPQTQPAATQPAINPATGQPDYSAQWAEYYRSVGLLDQAAMVESQMKQNAARAAGVAVPAGAVPVAAAGYPQQYQAAGAGAVPGQPNPAGQPYGQYQAVGAFPQTGQFQAAPAQQF